MTLDQSITKKRSLGKLHMTPKSKPRSPDMTGTMRLQRHTAAAILEGFEDSDCDEVVCNIAGWRNDDTDGPYPTVEISPKYAARETQPVKANRLAFIFDDHEERN